MDLIDDEHLVAIAHRCDRQRFDDDLTDRVDAGVGGPVDFHHVHIAAFGDLAAGVTLATGVGGGPVDAIECTGQNARRGGFADPARPGKNERLCEATRGDGIAKRVDDTTLADHILKPLRAPFSSESDMGHEWGQNQ